MPDKLVYIIRKVRNGIILPEKLNVVLIAVMMLHLTQNINVTMM
jgi:hypothetical protein